MQEKINETIGDILTKKYGGTSLLGHFYSGGYKLWSRKNAHIIFLSVTSVERTPVYSGKRDTFSGSQNPSLTSIQRTP